MFMPFYVCGWEIVAYTKTNHRVEGGDEKSGVKTDTASRRATRKRPKARVVMAEQYSCLLPRSKYEYSSVELV